MRCNQYSLPLTVATTLGFAVLGGVLSGDALTTWYPTLRKSRLVLPLWAFLPVAVLYYFMCGTILFRLQANEADNQERRKALGLLLGVMAANEGWNYLLFGRRSTKAGLWGMLAFVALTLRFYQVLRRVDPISAKLLQPYVLWLGYDIVYAFELWRLNRL